MGDTLYKDDSGNNIDDAYVANVVSQFDSLVEKELGKTIEKCSCVEDQKDHIINFADLPDELKEELRPFVLNI